MLTCLARSIAQRPGGHILADGGPAAVKAWSPTVTGATRLVCIDEDVVADGGVEFALAVVVAGDGAAAEVAVFAHGGIAYISKVADRVALGKVGVLGLHVGAQVAALGGFGAGAHVGEGPDLVVGADVALVALAGVDGGTFLHHGILQQGVGADDAAGADDGVAPQDAAGQDGSPRGNLHFGVDVDIAADEFHTVIQMALEGGGITLLRQFKIFFGGRHKNPPYI